jgi:hypothetical protein
MNKRLVIAALLAFSSQAQAQVFSSVPFNLQNGTTADASQVMANFNQIVANGNANAAKNGANSDISSLANLGNGSQTLPALRFLSSSGTGLFFDGTNLGFSVGGVEQAWVPPGAVANPSAVFIAGEIRMFAMNTCPTGWLEANGASLLQAGTYAGLFANIGTTWGSADGSHFNIPDLRGTVPRAWDHGRGLDPAAPAFAAYEADTTGPHNHPITDPGHTHGLDFITAYSVPGVGGGVDGGSSSLSHATGSNTTGITVNNNTGTSETRAKSTVLLYCIKS